MYDVRFSILVGISPCRRFVSGTRGINICKSPKTKTFVRARSGREVDGEGQRWPGILKTGLRHFPISDMHSTA